MSEKEKEEFIKKMYGTNWKEKIKLRVKVSQIVPPYMIENLKNEKMYKEKVKHVKEISNLLPKNFLNITKEVNKLLERKLLILENEEINQKVFKSKFFKNNAFKSVLECYKSKNYYAGVMVLATMIDGALIKIQEKKENRRKIGNNVSKEINNKSDESWSLEYILDYSLIIWLEKFFENANDFSNKKLNRNMLLHGMYEKEITELEFFQLLNVVYVMAERLDDWREKIN